MCVVGGMVPDASDSWLYGQFSYTYVKVEIPFKIAFFPNLIINAYLVVRSENNTPIYQILLNDRETTHI
jgi:hypothetical protein